MEGILRNAADPARAHQRYRPLATLSQGYDSLALAVLVKRLGGTEAMTFRRQNPRHAPKNDSGLDIGRYLGFDVTEYDALQFRKLPGLPEAEFFACPDGSDVVLAPVEAQLAGTVFITGRHGDCVFSLHRSRILSDLRIATTALAGMTMNEFRLRVGFVQYVPLFMAAQHIYAIHAISTAPEMKPWSIGGLYDRPIARRIVEEAGIPRDWFGRRKMASAHDTISRMESMSREGQADFARYLHTLPPIPPPRRLTDAARIAAMTTRAKWGDALNRHVRWLPEFLADSIYGMPCRSPSHTCFDFGFHWGYARIRSRYTAFRSGE